MEDYTTGTGTGSGKIKKIFKIFFVVVLAWFAVSAFLFGASITAKNAMPPVISSTHRIINKEINAGAWRLVKSTFKKSGGVERPQSWSKDGKGKAQANAGSGYYNKELDRALATMGPDGKKYNILVRDPKAGEYLAEWVADYSRPLSDLEKTDIGVLLPHLENALRKHRQGWEELDVLGEEEWDKK